MSLRPIALSILPLLLLGNARGQNDAAPLAPSTKAATPPAPATKTTAPPAPATKPSAPRTDAPTFAKPELERDDALRLQIFLDESKFGPGVIDGKPGRFTALAIASWNEVQGHPPEDWAPVIEAARAAIQTPVATTLIPECVTEWVDPELPTKRSLQAKKNRMSYRRVSEFMAERYHCDELFLIELNGAEKIKALKARDSILVPNVTPFRIEDLSGLRFEKDPELSERQVIVDTRINQVRIYRPDPVALVIETPNTENSKTIIRKNPNLLASFPITPGQPKFIQKGTWALRSMVELPWWRYDQTFLDTGKRGSAEEMFNIPPGPNSPVGIIWNGTSKPGIGLHGTSDPETIGRARSSGCIRLCNWDAIRLPSIIRPGSSIEIR